MSEIISPREAKAAHWHRVLAEQARSGQSIRVFCTERLINRHTFQYWRKKFFSSNQSATNQNPLGRFIAVRRRDFNPSGDTETPRTSTSPRVRLPNGVTIDLGDGFGAADVKKFLLKLCGVDLGGTDAKP